MKNSKTQNNSNLACITEVLTKEGSSAAAGYKLSNGETVSVEEAVQMAKNGEIKDVIVSSRNGEEYLKSSPDGDENNNLKDLPHHREY
ncbi:DUF3892 domain-containing protein [Clostridium thermobutyricum]|jgi:pyruvate carboxylase|uniref:DUF3892 domain-containing protein n=1 Tax=Clostridium thermobutyricum DSM 4928 TaxID=1121339 RepID=A0A1V4SSR1_9CLOT|nr:DUF3892 domain-containing protein [Clostridium thermobutyricum]OPX46882.1 hypothetical protein CLTHE_24360 [Clostridium thermobutyricum DSM 4928]